MSDKIEFLFSVVNEEMKIWRYVDFVKFESLLKMEALFFARASRFNDDFEGAYPHAQVAIKRVLEFLPKEVVSNAAQINFYEDILSYGKKAREWVMTSCWHMNEYESDAMWKLYAATDKSVCVQSTIKRFSECFKERPPVPPYLISDNRIRIGPVQYIDYARDSFPINNILYPFFHKRKEFIHEQEFRAVVAQFPKTENQSEGYISSSSGIYMPCNLDILIEKVYIAPKSSQNFVERIRQVLQDHKLNKQVIPSSLDDKPTY